jgi:small-conductance mechanosensitive channel/CRP-like cAMP-binding protein
MESGQTPSHLMRILRALAVPTAGLCLVAFLDSRIRSGAITLEHADKAVAIGYILLGIALAYRLVCEVLFDLVLTRASGRQIPKILKHLIGIATVLLAALLTVNVLHPGAFASLLTLSSVIAVVIGLALRPIILDIFSGVSANLDAAFRIGDWIEITRRGGAASHTGWVEEINWRTTHLRTRSGNLVVCPNSTLSTAIITNFSRPSRLSRYELRVKLPPELDPDRARRVLLAATRATLDRDGGPSSDSAPDVLITAMEASGVQYVVRFWLDPAKHSADSAVHTVARSVLHHLQFAGIPLSEKVVLHRDSRVILDPARPAARAEVLAKAALFSGVRPEALGQLAAAVRLAPFEQGDTLIRQGDTDHDLFLLVEGGVDVLVQVDGREVSVARMQAGDYFGEMSLLTGEARSATIRATTGGAAYRLGREAIAPLLESDSALMDLLSRNLAERNLSRRAKAAEAHGESPEQKQESLATVLLGKMMAIFRPGR